MQEEDVYTELNRIREELVNIQNCEDGEEMIAICLEIACDVESLMEVFDK